ncbi:ImmA/IrrE family metallo-endopeptidase [Candidatus Chloroploca sp. M-50]|uniref:ImmA/IrrE family metallo-endopeptidase n=1 Tax=Candidatus Chloroploca mongolica TaxID=2528176 RepID=A0ABS4D4M7_9CHLR|nr:ImmA/IrrE family metallo-endopeptidase [Candidatus Chloroploca mongolica]MBP1464377.1 ImmA/IrrE family metallo-endopeptidase [Candidatus Chloroploca mongolica]
MVEPWLERAAEQFWEAVGEPLALPRDLASVISRPFPLGVITLPALDMLKVEGWFAERNVPYRFLCQNRALCGCIVAARGHGLIFIDPNDPPAEQRFTVAHEVAHFLLDYLEPRQEALARLGESILPVLNGERAPTTDERIHALLGRVKLGFYQDMMPRTASGSIDQTAILRAEDRADRLALELLAPATHVLASATTIASTPFERTRALTELLEQQYGFPRAVARAYGTSLVKQSSKPSLAEWFGI